MWKSLSVLTLLLVSGASFADQAVVATITGGKTDARNVPVAVTLLVERDLADVVDVSVDVGGQTLPGQLTNNSLRSAPQVVSGPVRRDLHVVLPMVKAGATLALKANIGGSKSSVPRFVWKGDGKTFTELSLGDRPILRYMHAPYDDSSPDIRNKTYKVFHHLYDPAGKRYLTNGGHTNDNAATSKLLYPHHRGIQMGFNRVSYGTDLKKKADVWHCQKDDHQSHEGIKQSDVGPVLGRHRVAIDWHGQGKEVFAKEERELTIYNLPGGTMIDFSARVSTTGGTVRLDGDPQHAGFQFRAHNDVAEKTATETYYLRTDGKGKPNETRNWPQAKTHVNLPWNAVCFLLDGKRYTVCYLDHPDNPRETRHSERNYARFGCYFEYDITPETPLRVNYRLWMQEGEMDVAQVEALSQQYIAPPSVAVK